MRHASLPRSRAMLDGKVVIITGAASGIGRSTAELAAGYGARLVLGDVDTDGLDRVRSTLREAGNEITTRRSDVRVEDDCEGLADLAVQTYGGIDGAVLCAGGGVFCPPLEM